MKTFFLILNICIINVTVIFSISGQNVTILPSGITPNNIGSYPRLTYDQILALPSPQKGDLAMDLTFNHLRYYNGVKWVSILTTEDISLPLSMAWKAGGSNFDAGNKVVIDAIGNIYLTGYFYGTATFGTTTINSAGSSDVFIAKYGSDGNLLWVKKAGGSNAEIGFSVALDSNNNPFIVGTFQGIASFETTNIISSGSNDIFIAKYSSTGDFQWVQRAGGSGFDQGFDIKVNGNGEAFITGCFWGTATFASTTLVSAGGTDIFIAKYNSQGIFQWVQQAGGIKDDICHAIVLDGISTVYLTGVFGGTAIFGASSVTTSTNGIFIAKFRVNDWQWVTSISGDTYSTTVGFDIVIDVNKNIYIAGSFYGTIYFGTNNITSQGNSDIFIAKYNSNGVFQWVKQAGGTNLDICKSIAIDNFANLYVTGTFIENISFGNVSLSGGYSIFLAKFNSTTNLWEWGRKANSMIDVDSMSIAIKASDDVFTTGYFGNFITFGTTTLNTTGNYDIFLARWVY
jgi:hypothetical protein